MGPIPYFRGMIKRMLFLVAGAMATSFLWAQEPCLSHVITERWMHAHGINVDLAHETAVLEQEAVQRGGTRVIPVVVHVVWNTSAENVSDNVINNIINRINKDYQAQNSDYNQVRPAFVDSRGNAQIEFCLASIDPSGQPTTGIVRKQTTKTWFNPDTETDDMKFAPLGSPAWNTNKYLNIWICDISSGATGGFVTAGYAYLPQGGVVGTGYDGLVLDYLYGTADRTATHEIGHYLGLPHPWGNGNCNPGDGISDTPPTDSPTFSCSNPNLMKCNALTQYENFMDYSNCPVMFTNGQVSVMNNILNGMRASLLTSNGCAGDNPVDACIPTSTVGPQDGDFIDGVVLGQINNTNTGSTNGPSYNNYTNMSTTLARGGSYTLHVTTGEYFEDLVAAWIDFNGDHVFSSNEKIGEAVSDGDFQTLSFPFTVPTTAALGNTIMRVRLVFPDDDDPLSADPCHNFYWGETEDYGITITGPNNITGATIGDLTVRNMADHVVVSWPGMVALDDALVLDAAGRVVRRVHVQGTEVVIGTSDLDAGIYQLVMILHGERFVVRFAAGLAR